MAMTLTTVGTYHEFTIMVNPTPAIGGFRGKEGSLEIVHKGGKVFSKLMPEELMHLAECVHTIYVKGFAKSNIPNVLVTAEEKGAKSPLKLNLTPYPKGSWWESIQGTIHYFFGGKAVTETQHQSIVDYWKEKFSKEKILDSVASEYSPPASKVKKTDHFCNSAVIDSQLIKDYEVSVKASGATSQNRYHLIIDNKPQGKHHALVVSSGNQAHAETAPTYYGRLSAVQNLFFQFSMKKDDDLRYVERFGNDLRGIPHPHSHAIGLQSALHPEKQKSWWHRVVRAFSAENVSLMIQHVFARTLPKSQYPEAIAAHRMVNSSPTEIKAMQTQLQLEGLAGRHVHL